MEQSDEMIQLLQEIRDTQRAHFKKYCEFTDVVRQESKQAALEYAERAQASLELQRQSLALQGGSTWRRFAALLVYAILLLGLGAFFGAIISDLTRISSR